MKQARLAAALPALLALAACDAPPPPGRIQGQVGAGGSAPAIAAVVAAAQGGVVGGGESASVSVPPGAVDEDVSIALAEAPAAAGGEDVSVLGKAWSFTVDGADSFRFQKPVQLSLPFDRSKKSGEEPVGLSVWRDGGWEPVPGAREAGERVEAEVDHFSRYAPTQSKKRKGPPPPKPPATLLDAERWYCRVSITIKGAGQRNQDGDTRSYTISRTCEAEFQLGDSMGQSAMNEMMEQLAKRSIELPREAQKAMAEANNLRRWCTRTTKRTKEDDTRFSLRIDDRVDSDVEEWGEGGPTGEHDVQHQSVTGGASGTSPQPAHFLTLDVAKGTYELRVVNLVLGEVEHVESGTDQPERRSKRPAAAAWHLRDQPFSKDAKVLSGNLRIKRKDFHNYIPGVGEGENYGSMSGRITWTLSPVPFEEVELVLDPAGYDTWLPRGGPDEGTKGDKPLQVTARLQARGGGAPKAKLERLVVRLSERSRVPGVCLNRPLTGAQSTPDLKLACTESGVTVEDDGEKLVRKGSPFGPTTFQVECYDWGAWGALTAEGRLEDGRVVFATLVSDPSQEEVRLPKRDEDSKVADAWKKTMKADGLDDKDDGEKQAGNTNDGDGLTLWEEYRGLIAKGKHTRDAQPLDPRKKDLVVRNEIAQQKGAVERGLRLLEKAALIHVVELKKEELPDARRVNLNTDPSLKVCDQHGLCLVDGQTRSGGAGETTGTGPSPVSHPLCRVWIDGLESHQQSSEIPLTVAHELAHGAGVAPDHHGEDEIVRVADPLPPSAKIHDVAGNLTTATGLGPNAVVGEPGNSASGDVRCIMCYYKTFNWCLRRRDDGTHYYPVPAANLAQDTLCTDKKATGGNPFGDSRRGNCKAQMRIRDR